MGGGSSFIVAAQESNKARKASVVSLKMASDKLETLRASLERAAGPALSWAALTPDARARTHPSRGPDEAQRLLNTVPPEQRANMIADATADLEREKKESHALARHAAEKVRVAVQLVWGSDGGMAG